MVDLVVQVLLDQVKGVTHTWSSSPSPSMLYDSPQKPITPCTRFSEEFGTPWNVTCVVVPHSSTYNNSKWLCLLSSPNLTETSPRELECISNMDYSPSEISKSWLFARCPTRYFMPRWLTGCPNVWTTFYYNERLQARQKGWPLTLPCIIGSSTKGTPMDNISSWVPPWFDFSWKLRTPTRRC